MAFAQNGSVRIYYEVHGGGNDDSHGLVFAHGAGGNGASWWQQLPTVTNQFRTVVFDHRGFARSPCGDEEQNGIHFGHDLIAVMDAAGLRTASVVCQSMGGWTGVRAAMEYPARIRAVLLANTPGAIRTDATLENQATLSARIAGTGLIGRAISPEFAQRSPAGALLYQQIAAFNGSAKPNIFGEDVFYGPKDIATCGVPFWVLASELDPLFPPALLASVAKAIGAEYRFVEGAGHSTYFEKPEAFNAVLHEFLATVKAG